MSIAGIDARVRRHQEPRGQRYRTADKLWNYRGLIWGAVDSVNASDAALAALDRLALDAEYAQRTGTEAAFVEALLGMDGGIKSAQSSIEHAAQYVYEAIPNPD